MKFEYLEKGNPEICEMVLRSVPDWFGFEESTVAYIHKSKELPMVTVIEDGNPVGFLSLLQHSQYTSEVYVMGVIPEYERKKGCRKEIIN